MSRYTAVITLLFSLFLLPVEAVADQIRLKNGDVITGEIVRKETDKVIFKTGYAGELQIAWSEVANLRSDEPLRVVLTDDTSLEGRLVPVGAGKANVQVEEGDEAVLVDLSNLLYINPSAEVSGVGITWTGRANLGGAFARGNSNTGLLYFDAETIARRKNDRLTLGGVVNRAENDGEDTQFNSRAHTKYDYFLSRQWYAYANASGEKDKFRDIKLRTNTGFGSGYQVFERPELSLSLEAGLNYINTDYYNDEDEGYPGGRWALKYRQTVFGGDTQIFHDHEFLFDFLDGRDTLFFSKTGLRVPIIDHLKASTQLNVDWAKSPAPGRKSTDATLVFSLGYDW